MLNIEKLTPGELETVNSILKISGSPSAVTGVLETSAGWDQRPVVFARGKLWVVRVAPLGLDSDQVTVLRGLLQWSSNHGPPQSGTMGGWGQSGDQLWFRRRFEEHTLVELANLFGTQGSPDIADGVVILQQLVSRIKELHAAGSVHGHICPGNIALDGNRVRILDAGLGVAGLPREIEPEHLELRGFAPELLDISKRKRLSEATDVYGVGRVAIWLNDRGVVNFLNYNAEIMELCNATQAEQERLRPTLAALADAFSSVVLLDSSQVRARSGANNSISSKAIAASGVIPDEVAKGGTTAGNYTKPENQSPGSTRNVSEINDLELGSQISSAASHSAKQESSNFKRFDKSLSKGWGIGVILVFLALGVYFFSGGVGSDQYDLTEYMQTWDTGNLALKQQYVEGALAGDDLYKALLVAIAQREGDQDSQIRKNLIKTVFDDRWIADLSAEDKRTALALGFSQYEVTDFSTIPPLESLHPAVILGLAVDLPLASAAAVLENIPIAPLGTLPGATGSAFTKLAALFSQERGIDMRSPLVRAFAKALENETRVEESRLQLFAQAFSDHVETNFAIALLHILTVDSVQTPESWVQLLEVLSARSDSLAARAQWFNPEISNVDGVSEQDFAEWDKATAHDKLLLVAGLRASPAITFEQSVDLLHFPLSVVKLDAKARIEQLFPTNSARDRAITNIISFLASEKNTLTRSQSISLMSMLMVDPSRFQSLVPTWFATQPDPNAVAELLASRFEGDGFEPFAIEGARYLKDRPWEADLELLSRMAGNPEPLVRALVYSRLDPSVESEKLILAELAKNEPNERLRQEVLRKVEAGSSE